ncbi:MAG TPA: RNA polymerase sigma factor [Acidimicrobiia bacterium]|nr:RNA polymerase sigma factor [Acidimicrobiia bacterium]HKN88669.1 RNA polymerase sigma factor [Acidimicrobiia bacterium]HTC80271.1 RNA polymerase sigma factor [Acidimicrobiia bacterium]
MPTPTTRHSLGDQFQAILTAAQDGGEWAVAILYRWLHPAVTGYLRGRAGDDAEDLASETWLAVARALPAFSGDEPAFRSWVFTIAHRRLVDHHRASARRPRTRSLTPAEGDGHDGPLELPGAHDPAGEVEAALAGEEAVRRIVALLPPDQADIVLLRVVAGLPVEEVAAITGRQPGTVRVLQHRALRRLADRLERPVNGV